LIDHLVKLRKMVMVDLSRGLTVNVKCRNRRSRNNLNPEHSDAIREKMRTIITLLPAETSSQRRMSQRRRTGHPSFQEVVPPIATVAIKRKMTMPVDSAASGATNQPPKARRNETTAINDAS